MAVQKAKGTEDLFADDAWAWQYVSQKAYETFARYGYEPIETPLFEQFDLFVRGIGESTDVVGKEMFHVLASDAYRKLGEGVVPDAKHHLALRPEGTAGIVRAVVEHNLVPAGGTPAKLMYAGPMFRAERPQKGRLREFHQIGAECLGADEPSADAEVITMLMRFYEELGVPRENMRLLINSMGDDACRPAYRDAVRAFILDHTDEMCDECRHRAELNPLRAFDCKNEHCHEVMEAAPKVSDALCDDCKTHYEAVKSYLDAAGIVYEEDSRLVRGLDYYTRTVFEVQVVDGMGSQNAIGGGGRYDKLVELMGGAPTPGLGFAIGYERTILALAAVDAELPRGMSLDCYVAAADPRVAPQAFSILQSLRDAGISADGDHQARSLKSQLKLAGKRNVAVAVVVGPDELAAGEVVVRDMRTHEQCNVAFDQVPLAVKAML
jgi:histidyl-tRNA synthetase